MSSCWDCKHLEKRTGGFQYCLLLGRCNVDANKDRCDEFDMETMTTPTPPLSPAAQAVKDAVIALYIDQQQIRDWGWQLDAPTVAAALRAAADQVVPDIDQSLLGGWKYATTVAQQKLQIKIRSDFLAIAAELEQTTNTKETTS